MSRDKKGEHLGTKKGFLRILRGGDHGAQTEKQAEQTAVESGEATINHTPAPRPVATHLPCGLASYVDPTPLQVQYLHCFCVFPLLCC